MTIDYSFDSKSSDADILRIYYPYPTIHGNVPRPIYDTNDHPSLTQSHSFIQSISGSDFDISATDDIQVIATADNPTVYF